MRLWDPWADGCHLTGSERLGLSLPSTAAYGLTGEDGTGSSRMSGEGSETSGTRQQQEEEDVGVERSAPSKAQQQVAAYFRNIQDVVRDDIHLAMAEVHHNEARRTMEAKIQKMHSLARRVRCDMNARLLSAG